MKSGYRLHRLELRNWGTFHGDKHYVVTLGGESTCFTGLNQSGKSTAMDAILTLLVPHEFRHYNVAATMNEGKRERSIKTYIMGAYSKGQSPESSSGRTLYLRDKPGTLSILLCVFKDETFGRDLTAAQIHWVTASGEHQGRYLLKESDQGIRDLGIANVDVHGFASHFDKTGWHYETMPSAYYGKLQGLLRIPSPEALRLFCRAVSLKDVQNVTAFVRTLMLEPQNPAAELDKVVKHFADLDHIHSELQATKAEIAWLTPIEQDYRIYKEADDEVAKLISVGRALQVILDREAASLFDATIEVLETKKLAHDAEVQRLKGVEADLQAKIVDLNVSLRMNDAYSAIQSLEADEKKLVAELGAARATRQNLTSWLLALNYTEPVSTEAGFERLKKHTAGMLADETLRHEQTLEQRGAALAQASELRARRLKLAEDIDEMREKRTKIPRHFREMREAICQALGINEGLLPFVGELIDVRDSEQEWRGTLEVLLNNFALSVIVPDDLYGSVAAFIEHSEFRSRITYYRAPRGLGLDATLDVGRVYGKLQLRPDAWCRGWLLQTLVRDFDHRCCDRIEDFKAERGRAVTKNLHVKGGERSFKEAKRRLENGDFDVLGWANEAKVAAWIRHLAAIDAELKEKDAAVAKMLQEAKGISGGLALVRQIAGLQSYRSIDDATIETELTLARDRIENLKSNDATLQLLMKNLREMEGEKAGVGKLLHQEVEQSLENQLTLKKRKEARAAIGARLNQMTADFDWRSYEEAALEFRGDAVLTLDGLGRQTEACLGRVNAKSKEETSRRDAAEKRLGPLMADFLNGTADKGYRANWSASIQSAPAMVEHLQKLRNERFYVLEAQFKKEMDRILEEDIDLTKGALVTQQKANSDRIKEVNATLRPIEYNDGTFVEINQLPSTDTAVTDFRAKLENCTRQVFAMTPEQRLARFTAIKELITYIKEHRNEALKGANPNNWDVYVVAERRRSNPQEVAYWHTDSDGGSGGQKAKLACTVVAAALSFRMGHTRKKDSNAFRLVMIDEIFQKSDDENSTYALRIFEQFDLQLLLATPRDGRLKLVIPHVGSFHLFQNPTKASSSVVSITAAQARQASEIESTDADGD